MLLPEGLAPPRNGGGGRLTCVKWSRGAVAVGDVSGRGELAGREEVLRRGRVSQGEESYPGFVRRRNADGTTRLQVSYLLEKISKF